MNRRSFLSFLTAGAATAAVDHESLLWVPGKKVISVPKPIAYARQFSVDFEWDANDCRLSNEEFYNRNLAPAIASLVNRIDSVGIKRYRLAELPLPHGAAHAHTGPLGGINNVRQIRMYDLHRDKMIQRLDVLMVAA